MTVDRSGEIKSGNLNVRVRWRSPQHLWLYCSLMGVPPTAMTMPGHDPPVAWRAGQMCGEECIACPGIRTAFEFGQLPHDVPILDAEPGRAPAR